MLPHLHITNRSNQFHGYKVEILTTLGLWGDVLHVLGVSMDSTSEVVLGVGMVTIAAVTVVVLLALLLVVGAKALRLARDVRLMVGRRI